MITLHQQYRKEQKKAETIENIIELLAPFTDECMHIKDNSGISPAMMAKDRRLKAHLSEHFTSYETSSDDQFVDLDDS